MNEWTSFKSVMSQGTGSIKYYDIYINNKYFVLHELGHNVNKTQNMLYALAISLGALVYILTGDIIWSLVSASIPTGIIYELYSKKESKNEDTDVRQLVKNGKAVACKLNEVHLKHGTTKTTIETSQKKIRPKKKIGRKIEKTIQSLGS